LNEMGRYAGRQANGDVGQLGPLAWVALVVRLAISSARQGRAGTKLSVLSSETPLTGIPSSAFKIFLAWTFRDDLRNRCLLNWEWPVMR